MSKILLKAENITNNKYKKNTKDKFKPKSFELVYINQIRKWLFCIIIKGLNTKKRFTL